MVNQPISHSTHGGGQPDYPNRMDNISKYNLKQLVKLPHRESAQEWIANNLLDFHKQVCMLYGTISKKCTRTTCPRMTAGNKYVFLWSDEETRKPIDISASEYIHLSLDWIQEQVNNQAIFPQTLDQNFPPDYMEHCRVICKRILRVFAHIYHHHLHEVKELKEDRHMNTNMKHFIYFVNEFDLISPGDLGPLKMLKALVDC